MSRERLAAAMAEIERARRFTMPFLEDLTPEEWFWCPEQVTTHVAWQVGHMAAAQYMLCLKRVRGPRDSDEELFPASELSLFGRGSVPVSDAASYPPADELKRRFNAVYSQTLSELSELTDEELDVAIDPPHPMFNTKLSAVQFCHCHEFVHAGQIAMLRRLMGKAPLR